MTNAFPKQRFATAGVTGTGWLKPAVLIDDTETRSCQEPWLPGEDHVQ